MIVKVCSRCVLFVLSVLYFCLMSEVSVVFGLVVFIWLIRLLIDMLVSWFVVSLMVSGIFLRWL